MQLCARTPLYRRPPSAAPDPLLSMAKATEYCGLSYNSMRDAIERGQLKAFRRNKHGWHYVRLSELEKFMQSGIVGDSNVE